MIACGVKSTTLVIVEQHNLARLALCAALGAHSRFQVVASLPGIETAVEVIQSQAIDLALIDLDLPHQAGIKLMRDLAGLPVQVAALTSNPTLSLAHVSFHLGSSAFVSKSIQLDQLGQIVDWVRAGRTWIDPSVSRAFVDQIQQQSEWRRSVSAAEVDSMESAGSLLTLRELQVLDLVIEGWANLDIAEELLIAPSTVRAYISAILTKLEVVDRTQAAVKAYRLGLVS